MELRKWDERRCPEMPMSQISRTIPQIMSDSSFTQLGPYRIDRIVGQGGMGTVYAARNQNTDEPAAIKVLSPGLAADVTFRERFIAEIESLKKLHHPNIVQLHGFGEHDGYLYYAMELVEGTNLEQELVAGRRFNWREVTQIGIDITRALKHAHDHGVIHRDLKPANLLVDKQEQIKLTDFGIAKLFGATGVTSGGNVMGTADYMAPEQAAGGATTPRCDLYSLGCVMYALLAGHPPFHGKTIAEVVHKVRYQQPEPVTTWVRDIPRELNQIILELLVKDPEKRIRTALSLTHRLRSMQKALSISTTENRDFTSDLASQFADECGPNPSQAPPPDIAVRPTVSLPEPSEMTPTKEAARSTVGDTKPYRSDRATRDHFTRVETGSAWKTEHKSEVFSALPLLLILLLVIGGLTAGFWYTSRPKSVDALYAKIMAASERPDDLLAAESDVRRFLEQFPGESRRANVESLAEEIELYRLHNRLELRSRRRRLIGTLSPIEQTYLESIRKSEEDLESAITILKGLIQLYGEQEKAPIKTRHRQIVELARKQVPRWELQLSETSEGHTEMLEERLAMAEGFRRIQPDKAISIWQGIITLYLDKPWAVKHVQTARSALQSMNSSTEIATVPTNDL